MSEFKDDTFLARWLNNELSEEELAEFKASPEYKNYQRIVAGSENILSASFDQEQLLNKIKDGREGARQRNFTWIYAAAATIALALSFVFYSTFTGPDFTQVMSEIGEQKKITLPDGSEVVLNANSSLSYTEDDWEENRVIDLSGEAYFKVEKGNTFTVRSNAGKVRVLGTQFTVTDLKDYYEVKCYEGSVSVMSGDESEILKPKRGVRKMKTRSMVRIAINNTKPDWLDNKSSFVSVPLTHVLSSLQNQYDITFTGIETFGENSFTGSFPHDDLELALKVVFSSIPYDYQITNEDVVNITEE